MVHAQIILQLFAEFPDPLIRKSPFATLLSEKMERRRHTKLEMKKKVGPGKEISNMNPCASMAVPFPVQSSNRKVMRATTTRLINKFWGQYYSNDMPIEEEAAEEEGNEDDDNDDGEEEDVEVEVAGAVEEEMQRPPSSNKPGHSKSEKKEIKWEGASAGTMSSGWALYRSAMVRGHKISVGGAVSVANGAEGADLILVEYI